MKHFLLLFFVVFSTYSQVHTIQIENEKGELISNEEEKKTFLKNIQTRKNLEYKKASAALATQTAVEMCTNNGFEQQETVNGISKLKNFLYTIGDPPGPTQCRSITNTANSYIDVYNPNSTNVMATTVPSNIIDPYLGNIKAFDQFALKINYDNSSTYGSIIQGKRFKTNNENYFKFNFKTVLMTVYDSSHKDNQPFIKARIINAAGTVVSEFCLVGDETNCIFTKIPDSYAAILYTENWQSGLLDISSIPNNEEFTVEFMASRCGLGGHFGYMYVDDICLLHSNENLQGSIELQPLNKVCSTVPINVCGSYTVPNSGGITATLGTITLDLYDSDGKSVYQTTTTSSLDKTKQQFCFTLDAKNFPNILNANYNVGVSATYNTSGIASCSGTVFSAANDPDANPGWDISFQNCSTSCIFSVNTTKLSLCDANHDGSEIFNLTDANSNLVATTTGFTFTYFTTFADATANTNPISTSTAYSSTSKILYVRVAQNATCFKVIPISLEVKNPSVTISGILNVCSGSTVLTASTGTAYLWSTGATTQSATVTKIGTYSVTVTDIDGCSNSASVTIEPSQIATVPIVTVSQPSCYISTGTIEVTSPASQISFDNGTTWSTNATKSNLSPGTYNVKIKTVNDCISYPLEVTIYTPFTSYPNFNFTNPAFCGDFGTISITTSAAFYSFDDGLTWTTNPVATKLPNGTYKIRTKDNQGCISNFNTILISSVTLEKPTFTIINPACGENGNITVNTVADFYTFDGGKNWVTSNIFTDLTTGNYSVAIKNKLGCTSEFTNAYISDLNTKYPESSVVQPICGTGGSIAIATIGDFYSFDNGKTWTTSNIATNLDPGTYQIMVKNAAGCTSLTNYAYLSVPYLDQPFTDVLQPGCDTDGSITINTLSDFYSFDGGTTWETTNVKTLPSGSYMVMIKNKLGCISRTNYIYLNNPVLTDLKYTFVQPTCGSTGSITITTTAALYSIDGGSNWSSNPIFTNLVGGSYNLKIKNSAGCESNTFYVSLNVFYLEDAFFTYTNPSCGNIGNITISSTADFYSIDGGVTWSTSATFNNLTSDNYYVMVKNNAGCRSNAKGIYLDSYTLQKPTLTIVYPCAGVNGSITFTTTAAYYSIDDGVTWTTNPVFSNLVAGYYYVKIKNSTGCVSNYYYVNLSSIQPRPTYTAVQPICGTKGSITVTTTAASYSIDNGSNWSTNPVFSNLGSGYYSVKIKNTLGCESFTESVNFTEPYINAPTATVTQPTCNVQGSITVTTSATGYSKDGGNTWQTSPIFSNLPAGYYSIKIKNNLGCISNSFQTLINQYYLPNPNLTIVQPNCGNNGSITIATVASEYSFDGGGSWQTSPLKSNLTTGYYTVMIKNSVGCTSSPYLINVPINPYYLPNPLLSTIQPSCGTVGKITVLTNADFYSFDDGKTWTTNPILLNPVPGFYNVKVKNNLGCTSLGQFTNINASYLAAPAVTTTQPSCAVPTGTIEINTPASQFSFDNGATWTTNPKNTNLPLGYYYIKIKSSIGCESNAQNTSIGYPPATNTAPITSATQPTSCGTTDGSITVVTTASEYSFNDGVTWTSSPTKINLAAGTYFIKTRSSTSTCGSKSATVTLNSGTVIAAPTFTVTNPGCNNLYGAITITTPASYYSFDNGLSYVTTNTKSDLLVGDYKVKIKNAAGCISDPATAIIKATSSNLAAPLYTVVQPNCSTATGTITITTNAAFYSFDDGNTFSTSKTQTDLPAGNYSIKIKDASGCLSLASSVTINVKPTVANAPVVAVTHPLNCTTSTGKISVTSFAALFSFDNGVTWSSSNTSGPLTAGTYQVVVKETISGCPSLAIAAIINAPPNAPSAPAITAVQPTTCANPFGTITITSAAFEYSFDNGITYTTNPNSGLLIAGNYQVKVRNSFYCESTSVAAEILAPIDYPLAPNFTAVQPDCNNSNGTITIQTVASEYSFDNGVTWSASATSNNVLPATYQLKIKNSFGCISPPSAAAIIPFTNFTAVPTATSPQTYCIQQNVTLSDITISGQNIKWYDSITNGSQQINTLTIQNGSTYYASQTIDGCESMRVPVLISITNTNAPTGSTNQTFCSSLNPTLNSITVTGTAIKWYDSASNGLLLTNNTPIADGTIYYASQTANSCESVSRLAVKVDLITTLPSNDYEELLCDDLNDAKEIVDLTSYSSKVVANTIGHTFAFYTSQNGAENELLTAKISSPATYNLVLGSNKIYIRINSNSSCYAVAVLTLIVVAKPNIPISDIVPICENSSITISAGGTENSYLWSTGETTPSITVVDPGIYSVTATTNYGTINCSSTKSFTVKKSTLPTISSIETKDWTDNQNTITILVGGTGTFEYSVDGMKYQDNNQFENLIPGKYAVFVRDKNGCGYVEEEVYLVMYPKFFTPNNDGYNDTWRIQSSEFEEDFIVKIFDRYGKLIKVLSKDQSWDGTYNGQILPSTDYWFIATKADKKEYRGHFTLKR
ncbi:hypothetical protein FFWV33_09630 [Flavobacterium faecale]|uniref:Ig-like domain-containing protein n=1 Tax=Flavobacterium faecale TaxID=1355330 RepID=A0A2S1LDE7_9FLAO|nr:T9SS type B sorting domain-containing protein [Flavobacterium faecale]AWG21783.1 hypothetical protein FFWV33_09630 [Flavobacterium faecale]